MLYILFQPVEPGDEAFWAQFWSDSVGCVQDVFTLIPAAEIRALREESPSNLATLCYKAVEKLVSAAESGCGTTKEQQTGENFYINYKGSISYHNISVVSILWLYDTYRIIHFSYTILQTIHFCLNLCYFGH